MQAGEALCGLVGGAGSRSDNTHRCFVRTGPPNSGAPEPATHVLRHSSIAGAPAR